MLKAKHPKNFSGLHKKSLSVCYPPFFFILLAVLVQLPVICCNYVRQGY